MKKLVLTFAAIAIMGVCCAQSHTLNSESTKAANQAALGNVSGAAKTASSTWQNHDISKGSTPGMFEAVEKKVKEAEQKQKQKNTSSSTTRSTTTSSSSTNSSSGKKNTSSSKK